MFDQTNPQPTNPITDDALTANFSDPLPSTPPTDSPVGDSPFTPPALHQDPIDTSSDNSGTDTPTDTTTVAPSTDELLNMKQQVLQKLSPLVGHLEQSPEEKFRTTMMMIQASDDQSLLNSAYEAAQQITDDKARAQALLDVVNEINYFTQQHSK
jgi:hypothetical protein